MHQPRGFDIDAHDAGFDISQDAGAISLSVAQGEVRIAGPGLSAPEYVTAGQRFGIRAGGATTRLSAMPPDQIGLWQEGLIISDDETIAATVTRIPRWHNGRAYATDSPLAGTA
ncbi:hypothetical protein [Paracoccus sp. IB05]|uniref:hypothetical protein n=1 Tax=Paracoccus sp. IB05 TaxID=2779367 RepID=UPI0018E7DA30|nr:hypothetical protein [Paracoccus sp. IB05]MBJ2151612.1 hypothetical protein [Paracoccus sp. IB05]